MSDKRCKWSGRHIPEGQGVQDRHGDYYYSQKDYVESGAKASDKAYEELSAMAREESAEAILEYASKRTFGAFFLRLFLYAGDGVILSVLAVLGSGLLGNCIFGEAPLIIRKILLGSMSFALNNLALLIYIVAFIIPLIMTILYIFIKDFIGKADEICFYVHFIIPVFCTIFGAVSYGGTVQLSEKQLAKKAVAFEKTYNSEMDMVVEKKYNVLTVENNKLKPKNEVFLTKDGLAHYYGSILYSKKPESEHLYKIDTKNRLITLKKTGLEKSDSYLWYTADGSVIYPAPRKDDIKNIIKKGRDRRFSSDIRYGVFVREDATFIPENAKEVIGKTYNGKWDDSCDATITFGNDGNATVKFSNGKIAQGAYIANDEGNFVLYNHNNQGIWFAFFYIGNSADNLTFLHFRPMENIDKYSSYRQTWTKSK